MDSYFARGVGLLLLVAAARGAQTQRSAGGQCTILPVLTDLNRECMINRTSYNMMSVIVGDLNGRGSDVTDEVPVTALLDVLDMFCEELPLMETCVISGIPSCRDRKQKLEIDEAFALKATICDVWPMVEPLLETYDDEPVITRTCASKFGEMMSSCPGLDLLNGVDPFTTSMSEMINVLNKIRDALVECLVSSNYASLSPDCDRSPPYILSLYIATAMHVVAYPGLTFTPSQFQQLLQLA